MIAPTTTTAAIRQTCGSMRSVFTVAAPKFIRLDIFRY
jgi:hypothetical protein